MYYRNAQAAIVVYDISDEESYDRAKYWLKKLKREVSGHFHLIFSFNSDKILRIWNILTYTLINIRCDQL